MPHKPRFPLPGVPQHVIELRQQPRACFLSDADYRRYLDDL